MRRGPRWSQSGRGPLADAAGASVFPKRRGSPRPCGGGLGGPKTEEAPTPCGGALGGPKEEKVPTPMRPKTEEAPTPIRRGPWWSGSGGGPIAHAAGASVVPKRRRPPRPCGRGLGGPKAKQAPSPMRRGPGEPQNGGGAHAHAAGVNCTVPHSYFSLLLPGTVFQYTAYLSLSFSPSIGSFIFCPYSRLSSADPRTLCYHHPLRGYYFFLMLGGAVFNNTAPLFLFFLPLLCAPSFSTPLLCPFYHRAALSAIIAHSLPTTCVSCLVGQYSRIPPLSFSLFLPLSPLMGCFLY